MKNFLSISIVIVMMLSFVACSTKSLPEEMPEDFSFEITWGTYGVSSYDSKTGELVKTSHATNTEDYVTKYELSDENKRLIYDYIRTLNPDDYPDEYNPNEGVYSEPSMTLILTVCANGTEKTIKAENIAHADDSKSTKGRRFLSTCNKITDILTSSEEWKALPDYEFLYD